MVIFVKCKTLDIFIGLNLSFKEKEMKSLYENFSN